MKQICSKSILPYVQGQFQHMNIEWLINFENSMSKIEYSWILKENSLFSSTIFSLGKKINFGNFNISTK
jgi:hypothetical protein